jgi:hypothetical protein
MCVQTWAIGSSLVQLVVCPDRDIFETTEANNCPLSGYERISPDVTTYGGIGLAELLDDETGISHNSTE